MAKQHGWAEEMFFSAPKEIQDSMVRTKKALIRWNKSKEQFVLWEKEMKEAERDFEFAQEEHGSLVSRWDEKTNTITPKLEEFNKVAQ